MKIILDGERPLSWNTLKRMHWRKWQNEVDRVKWLVRAELDPSEPPLNGQVIIRVTAYFAHHPQDASNIGAKLYEDGLIGTVLIDDNPTYVSEVRTRSMIDKKRPRVEIEIMGDVNDSKNNY